MSAMLHKIVSLLVAAVLMASPAWCFCASPAPVQPVKTCCMHQKTATQPQGDNKHSPACPHCGKQVVKAPAEGVQVGHLSPMPITYALMSATVDVESQLRLTTSADESPPRSSNPVALHFVSLT